MYNNRLLNLTIPMLFLSSMTMEAHFNTITDKRSQKFEVIKQTEHIVELSSNEQDTTIVNFPLKNPELLIERHDDYRGNYGCYPVRKKHLDYDFHYKAFPDLTLNNLLREIRKNGIQYEEIVLAQAILETGWFTSPVCRNKKNLFGLTNPRTGDYYEFDRWQDSVEAYYTKVQYKYKGGNYLLWLDQLPYATRTTYISTLIVLLKQYFI